MDSKFKVGQYVEWQPPSGGKSYNLRIKSVLTEGEYFTTGDRTIKEEDILGRNLHWVGPK